MKTKLATGIAVLAASFLLASAALAMSSAGYRLEWFTPLTNGGGSAATSASYGVNYTIGQTARGVSSSASYGVELGYWYGAGVSLPPFKVYLPLVVR